MIISFNPEIIHNQDISIQKVLGKILSLFLENNHFIAPQSISDIFFDGENQYIFDKTKISQNYLLKEERENLKEYICTNRMPVTQLHEKYLTHLVIGTNVDEDEIHPSIAYEAIKERSLIIIENNPNDGKFITGIIDKYQSFGKRRSIYILIKQVLDKQNLIYHHSGGSGIKDQIEICVNGIYKNISRFKLLVIFDSDKTYKTDFKREYKGLIEYIKRRPISNPPTVNDLNYENNDLIVWHILFKRCIENYLPLNVILTNITNLSFGQKSNLQALTSDEMDFIQYYKPIDKPVDYYISIGKSKVKEQFPEMFLSTFSPTEMEDRCRHHLVKIPYPDGTIDQVSEIEQILLKIAKII
jgi:hypothetical protein